MQKTYYAGRHCKITCDLAEHTLTIEPNKSTPTPQWNVSMPAYINRLNQRRDMQLMASFDGEHTNKAKNIPSALTIRFKGGDEEIANNMSECIYLLDNAAHFFRQDFITPELACKSFNLPYQPWGREFVIKERVEGITSINVNDATRLISIRIEGNKHNEIAKKIIEKLKDNKGVQAIGYDSANHLLRIDTSTKNLEDKHKDPILTPSEILVETLQGLWKEKLIRNNHVIATLQSAGVRPEQKSVGV